MVVILSDNQLSPVNEHTGNAIVSFQISSCPFEFSSPTVYFNNALYATKTNLSTDLIQQCDLKNLFKKNSIVATNI